MSDGIMRKPQRIDPDKLMAFLDELTNLSRKYKLIVVNFQVGEVDFATVQQGRYFTDAGLEEDATTIGDVTDCYFDTTDDLSTVIDLTKV